MLGKIYGVGALNLDLIFKVPLDLARNLHYKPGYEYFARESEARGLLNILEDQADLQGKYGGGSAANTMVALSRLGFPCSFVGKVGEDREGDILLESLERVDKKEIIREGKSGLCITLLLGDSSDRSLVICPNTNDTFSYEEMPEDKVVSQAGWFHFTSFNGDKPFQAQCRLAEDLISDITLSLDPGMLYAGRGLKSLLPILKSTDYFFPERKEVEVLTGTSWKEGTRRLIDCGPKVVICTLGEDGVFVVHKNGEFHVPALEVPVVDTTGAGDVFVAGFIGSRLKDKSLEESVQEGVSLASKSITGMGRGKYPGSF